VLECHFVEDKPCRLLNQKHANYLLCDTVASDSSLSMLQNILSFSFTNRAKEFIKTNFVVFLFFLYILYVFNVLTVM